MPFIDDTKPNAPTKLKPMWTEDGYMLFWKEPNYSSWRDKPVKYVVYQFDPKEDIDISNDSHVVGITTNPWYKLPYNRGKEKKIYVVTALTRLGNEGSYAKKKIKL